jgi:hypothetical protein
MACLAPGCNLVDLMLTGGIELRDDQTKEVVWSRYLPRCLKPGEVSGKGSSKGYQDG